MEAKEDSLLGFVVWCWTERQHEWSLWSGYGMAWGETVPCLHRVAFALALGYGVFGKGESALDRYLHRLVNVVQYILIIVLV